MAGWLRDSLPRVAAPNRFMEGAVPPLVHRAALADGASHDDRPRQPAAYCRLPCDGKPVCGSLRLCVGIPSVARSLPAGDGVPPLLHPAERGGLPVEETLGSRRHRRRKVSWHTPCLLCESGRVRIVALRRFPVGKVAHPADGGLRRCRRTVHHRRRPLPHPQALECGAGGGCLRLALVPHGLLPPRTNRPARHATACGSGRLRAGGGGASRRAGELFAGGVDLGEGEREW